MNKRLEFYRTIKAKFEESNDAPEYIFALALLTHDLTRTMQGCRLGKLVDIYRVGAQYTIIDKRTKSETVIYEDDGTYTLASSVETDKIIKLLSTEYHLKR